MLIRSTMEKFSFHRGETFVPSWGSFCSTMVEPNKPLAMSLLIKDMNDFQRNDFVPKANKQPYFTYQLIF